MLEMGVSCLLSALNRKPSSFLGGGGGAECGLERGLLSVLR